VGRAEAFRFPAEKQKPTHALNSTRSWPIFEVLAMRPKRHSLAIGFLLCLAISALLAALLLT
jgi:hypothetical protein